MTQLTDPFGFEPSAWTDGRRVGSPTIISSASRLLSDEHQVHDSEGSERREPMRSKSTPLAIALLLALTFVATTADAGSLTPTPVKTTGRDEFIGSGNAGFFAWTQNAVGEPGEYLVWVEPSGGQPFQVTQSGVSLAGKIGQTGSLLPYHRIRHGAGDIKLFDMALMTHQPLPAGINTPASEFFPAHFGNQLTFVRRTRRALTLYLVTDLATGVKVKVRELDPDRAVFANVPNLYGNWVTYAVCNRRICDAFRYDIGMDATEKIPNPRDLLYFAPSADLAGNVYLERSGYRCGRSARMMKWTGTGNPSIFYAFDRGIDMTGSSVFDDGAGAVTVYVDFLDCATGKGDIYSFANP
jgi:hypothetical protein